MADHAVHDFALQIVTPAGPVLNERVDAIYAPAVDGYFGVLAHHAPLVAALGPGVLTVHQGEARRYFAVTGGVLEVERNNRVVVLGDAVTAADTRDAALAVATPTAPAAAPRPAPAAAAH